MKAMEFNKNYELSKSAKGVRAVPKGSGGFPEALTADGEIFNSEKKYFFFDTNTQKVRETLSQRRIDAEWLGGFGLRIVKIENLRACREDALSDGQDFFKRQIQTLQELIADFETEKSKS